MKLGEQQLKCWFTAALVSVVAGIAFAVSSVAFDSPMGLIFRAVFGLVAAVIVIGFYFTMFAEAMHGGSGLRRGAAIALFLLFPIGSALIYYGWSRYVRNQGACK